MRSVSISLIGPEPEPKNAEPRWPLWSLLWRMLLFGPILMPLGLFALITSLAAFAFPFFAALYLITQSQYAVGLVVLIGAVFCARIMIKVIRWLLAGIEHSSL